MKGKQLRSFVLVLSLLASTALGQSYPIYQSTTVNDYAQVLPADIEARIAAQLRALKAETGVEMSLLTLESKRPYAPNQTLEEFSTGLFDKWGIGDRDSNNGVLILILTEDREMRIELGAAYSNDWDRDAKRVVDNRFVPALSNDDYVRGLQEGTTATIDEIVMPFLAGQDPRSGSGGLNNWALVLFGAFAVLSYGRGLIGDQLARVRKCPSCGQRGLRQTRQTTMPASRTMSGSGVRTRRCVNCDHVETHVFVIPQKSSSSGGFGGGRSGGGGASGRF
ncbi:YgcG family protein [uncultured Roseobacter sp.]|uniref:TPM domain-containing protein n=1 Tax=uncultured Roseobacter sp. TaxID=114847 RepID=UPI00261026A6|nr:TPM domain-containing protein [uncultured Roseobacter sp.]